MPDTHTPDPAPIAGLVGQAVAAYGGPLAQRVIEAQHAQEAAMTEQRARAREPLADELDEYLADGLIDDDSDWIEPADQAQADALLGVLRAFNRRSADVKATADARVQEILKWQMGEEAKLARDRARIEERLEGWARAQHEASGGRTVTWKLPSGTLKLPVNRQKVHVLDDKESPELVRRAGFPELTSEHPATWTVAKKAVTELVKGRPADAALGPIVTEIFSPEPGYMVHYIPQPGTDPDDGAFLPGVYMLVPLQERGFKATPLGQPEPEAAG